MAVRLDAASDRVAYTGGAPAPSAGFTLTAWALVAVDTDDFATIARLYNGGTAANLATSGDGLGGPNYFTAGGTVTSSTGFVAGQWRKVAMSCSGTSGAVYAATAGGGTEVDTGTVAGAASPNAIALGGREVSDSSEWLNGRLAYVRVWAAVLSQAEIEAEWASTVPVRTANLWADWPLQTHVDLTDHSGNGRHLTAGATSLTTEAGPPLATDTPGAATGTGGGTGTAAGVREVSGQAVGVGGGAGTVVGVREVAAQGSSGGGGVGAATGIREVPGAAAGAGGGLGAVAGVLEVVGVASGAGGGAGAAAVVREVAGVAVGSGGGLGRIVVIADARTPPARTVTVPSQPRVVVVPAESRVVEV